MAISADPPATAASLAVKSGLSFPLLSDPDRSVIQRYGVDDPENEIAWPAVFVIGPDRKIIRRWTFDSYKERPPISSIIESLR